MNTRYQVTIAANKPAALKRSELERRFAKTVNDRVVPEVADDVQAVLNQLNDLQMQILWQQLQTLGFELTLGGHLLLEDTLDMYQSWFDETARVLSENGYPLKAGSESLDELWTRWNELTQVPEVAASVHLVQATLKHLPAILTGETPATDILFPKSSMEAVSGSYAGNPVADYFNQVLADVVVAAVELKQSQGDKLRILEIGAGTGGTSSMVFKALKPHSNSIEKYTYTDISRAFLIHAQDTFGPDAPYLDCQIFNVEQPLTAADKAIALGHYDVVIATNVLHATKNIHNTLRNAKAAMKPGGIVLINEIVTNTLTTHLTFGLTEGWWLSEDPHLRIPGCPGLSESQWQTVLQDEGFTDIDWPAEKGKSLGQQVILASSDHIIRHVITKPVEAPAPVKSASKPKPAVKAKPASNLQSQTEQLLKAHVAEALKLEPGDIDTERPLSDYGMDSILVVQLADSLSVIFGEVSSTLLFEFPTVAALTEYFLEDHSDTLNTHFADAVPVAPAPSLEPDTQKVTRRRRRVRQAFQQESEQAQPKVEVAIVGLAGRYPQAPNVSAYWDNLKAGKHCIEEVPAARWDWREFYDEKPGQAGKTYSRWGGFIADADCFDPLYFHISPKDAHNMDPQERVFLQTAHAAMEDAGYIPEDLSQDNKVGVFVGVMNSTYHPITSYWSIANRVSYAFDFKGPSLAVDTACSSSLTAIHLAVESLKSGASSVAIAGGVNLILRPMHMISLASMRMLTPDAECKSFGAGADGFVDGEGVGAIVLKPLAQAEQDNNHCYAVIKGSAVNAGGRTQGYSVPSPGAQGQVIADAIKDAQIDAKAISYIEAHGTGTELGDPIEITGLSKAFAAEETGSCALGSVKSNIGHLESAAGIAGVTKILLQMKHQQLVPTLHSEQPNPKINFDRTPFVLQRELSDWQPRDYPRIAGISSFGAGGSNAHVILQEHQSAAVPSAVDAPRLVVLSAKSPEQLSQVAADLLGFIEAETLANDDLADVCYTLQVGRKALEVRAAIQVSNIHELKAKLQDFGGSDWLQGVVTRDRRADEPTAQDVEQMIGQGAFEALLGHWSKGLNFDWQRLYEGGQTPKRVSLPTYPFARERYWIEATPSVQPEPEVKPVDVKVESKHLHTLLHENTSSAFETRFTSRFDGTEPFFADHQIQGQKLLPGTAYLEMARAAIYQAFELQSQQIALSDVVWLRPLVAQGSNTPAVNISINPLSEQAAEFDIYSVTDDGKETIYCQGRADIAEAIEAPVANLAALKQRSENKQYSGDDMYARLAEAGFGYGPSHQGIQQLTTGSGEVFAELALTDHEHDYALHPGLLDSVLQTAMGISLDDPDAPAALPFALNKLTIYQALPAEVYAWVRFSEDSQPGDAVQKLDIQVADQDGRVCLELEGFSSRSIQPKPETAAVTVATAEAPSRGSVFSDAIVSDQALDKQPAITLLYTSDWETVEPGEASDEAFAGHRICLIGGFGQDEHKALQAALPEGVECVHFDVDSSALAEGFNLAVETLFTDIKAYLGDTSQGATRTQLVVNTGRDSAYGAMAGLMGMYKTAGQENPKLGVQLIEIAAHSVPTESLLCVLRNEAGDFNSHEVRYSQNDNGQWLRQLKRWSEVASEESKLPVWRNNGVYLITGGLGGLGLVFANHIAEQCSDAKVILTGRRDLDESGRDKVDALTAKGLEVSYAKADVSSLSDVEQLLADIKEGYGTLTGILHSAGVSNDNYIVYKQPEELAPVLAPKVAGLVNLDRASREFELDMFACFSSVTGCFGNIGQADYAAANGFMDRFARYRNQLVKASHRHGRTVSINWPYWDEGGNELDAAVLAKMAGQGQMPLDIDRGMAAFDCSVKSGLSQVVVLSGVEHKLKTMIAIDEGTVELSSVVGVDASEPVAVATSKPADIENQALGYFKQQLADALEMTVERVDLDAPLEEYGMDSVLAMDLTNHLEQFFGPLSKTLFFEVQTTRALSEYFIENHHEALQKVLGVSETTPVPAAPVANIEAEALGYFKQQLADALEMTVERVDLDAPLEEYGMDSVLAMDLTNHLEQFFGPLSKTLFFEVQTTRALSEYFIENHSEALQKVLGVTDTAPAPAPVANIEAEALGYFKQQLADALEMTVERVDVDAPLEEYGMDSVLAMDLTNHLEQFFGPLSKTLFFEVQTTRALSEFFIENHSDALQKVLGVTEAAPAPAPVANIEAEALSYFKQQLADALEMTVERVDLDAPLEEYGMDSVLAMDLTNHLEQFFGPLSKTLFFEVQTTRALAEYFIEHHNDALRKVIGAVEPAPAPKPAAPVAAEPVVASRRRRGSRIPQIQEAPKAPEPVEAPKVVNAPDTVAIIGVSGRYPQASDLDVFWDNLKSGKDCIEEIPQDRWDHGIYFDPTPGVNGKTYTKWGGFLEDMDKFDPLFFSVSPRDADYIDPQERLFLQCVYNTLEDAGYTRESLSNALKGPGAGPGKLPANVGVFVGVMYEEYQLYAAQAQALYYNIAISGNPSSVANRVSYWCNFSGPSLAVDTMCSSSLMALHLAVQHLQKGSCDAAIAGGVNLSIHPNKYLILAQGNFASSKGRCESFGSGGDGYVPGEGVGALLLKPTAKAEADGDHIYAIVRGTAVNHGGKTNGYTVPNPLAQAEVIAKALEDANVDPRTISYIEAHGTGTSLGDPIEIRGLTKAFGEKSDSKDIGYCAIGSVKSNIGHCESASGVAGISKILLQMKHKKLAPSLHSQTLNPHIDFASTPFVVQQALADWHKPTVTIDGETREYPRIAGISSFGAGGSNAHIILEEYENAKVAASCDHPPLVVFSAKSQAQLAEQAQNLLGYIRRHELAESDLLNLCYTLQVGREALGERAAVKVASLADLQDKLSALAKGQGKGWKQGSVNKNKAFIDEFASDEDAGDMVAAWIAKGKYDKLLDLWAKGWAFDWQSLYKADALPQRISLPTYPFVKQRFWVDAPTHMPLTQSGPANQYLHPLLHENTSTSFDTQFTSRFDGNEFFFADHQIQGQKVLPGTGHLEMARAAVVKALALDDETIELQDVAWLRPIVFNEGEPLTVHISINPLSESAAEFEIYSVNDSGAETLYSQGRAEVVDVVADAVDVEALKADCGGETLDAEAVYAQFEQGGFAYGPQHRAIQSLSTCKEGISKAVGHLALDEEAMVNYAMHPGMLDGVLQSTIGLLSGNDASGPALPFALGALRLYRPLPAELYTFVSFAEGCKACDPVQKLDIQVCDADGNVCAELDCFSTRAVAIESRVALQEPELQTLVPQWQIADEPMLAVEDIRFSRTVIVGSDNAAERLAAEIDGAMRLSLADFADEQTFSEALGDDAESIDRLIWLLPQDTTDAVDSDELIAAQNDGVIGGLNLIQTLLAKGYMSRTLQLGVISWQTQLVAQVPHYPAHASIHGFMGSVAKECSRWTVKVLDVPMTADTALLLDGLKLAGPGSGEALAYREQQWYRQQMQPAELTQQRQEVVYRENGVYVVIGGAGGLGEVWSETLIRECQAQIVWLGRRALDETIQGQLDKLAEFGPAPDYVQADATDRESMENARKIINQKIRRHSWCGAQRHSAQR